MESVVVERIEEPTDAEMKAKRRKRIILVTAVVFFVALVCVLLQSFNTSSINISANFSYITEGKNPDGSPFNINELLCDEVLEKASLKLDGRVEVSALRKHLSISDGTSVTDIARLKNNITAGNTDYSLYPNVYTLSYSIVSHDIKRSGIFASVAAVFEHISLPDKKKILNSVAESYSEYYFDKYVAGNAAMELDWSDTDTLDYYNKAAETKAAAEKVSRFILSKYNRHPEFVSSEGIGYGDLYTEIDSIISIDVNNFISYVIQNGVTSDRPALLRQFAFMEDLYNENQIRHTSAYGVAREVIALYDSDTTKVVFIPALDEERAFYMNRTKVGIDYLIERASSEKIAADNAFHNAQRYRYLTARFSDDEPVPQAVLDVTEAMYVQVKEKINNFVAGAEKVIAEGSGSDELEAIEIGKPFGNFDIVSMAVIGAKIFVTLLLITFLLASLFEYAAKKYAKKRTAGEK